MSRLDSFKKARAYVYMPLLFSLIGYGILYFTLSPILSPVFATLNLMISEDKSNYETNIQSIFVDNGYGDLSAQDTVDEKDVQMPTYGTHYARLEISAASIESDLYFGDSSAVLEKGVGQYIGSSIPGYGKPLLISGHNNGAFNKLQYVAVGDIVTITTNYGLYEYAVTETRIATSSDKSAYTLEQKNEQLILYTCYPFNTLGLTTQRFFVYADKVSGPVIVSDTPG